MNLFIFVCKENKIVYIYMIFFFRIFFKSVIVVESNYEFNVNDNNKFCWFFGEVMLESEENL